LPQVSGDALVKFLENLGYKVIRQRGSHIRLRKYTDFGEHNVTVPNHKVIAKGTLNDILNKIGYWNKTNKEELIKKLNEGKK